MKLVVVAALAVLFAGCSSSKSDSKPVPTTPFGKATAATWLSECIKTDQWFYKESMTLDGVSAGATSGEYFADRNCTQPINRKDSANFNYSSREISDTHSTITIFNPKDNNKATSVLDVTLSNNGNSMRVTTQTGLTINYQRAFDQTKPDHRTGNDGTGGPESVAFDRRAVGTWVMVECKGGVNNQSYTQIITIKGRGAASEMYNIYNGGMCTGNPQPTQETALNYKVKQFANDAGQIEVAGEALSAFFQGPTYMNLTNMQGQTTVYKRVR